jgi:hypothetical protein
MSHVAAKELRETLDGLGYPARHRGQALALGLGGRLSTCVVHPPLRPLDARTDVEPILQGLRASYHEAFYGSYLRDDLAGLTRECGFAVEEATPHLVSKVVVGRKVASARRRRRPQA